MRQLALAVVSIVGVVVVGCGGGGGGRGGGGGGSGSTGNPAIDATVNTLFTSMRGGAQNLDGSITNGTVANPLANPAQSTNNQIAITGGANDGTVQNVNVTVNVVPGSDGSSVGSASVTEVGTNFAFLTVTQTINAPQLSVRVPTGGLSGLATNGTGNAFIIVRAQYTATLTRTFNNTSTSAQTLVTFGTAPAVANGTVTQNSSGFEDFIVHYVITTGTSGLTARIQNIADGSGQGTATRQGGPATSPLNQNYSTLTVGGLSLPANNDAIIAIGSDTSVNPSTGATAAVTLNFSLSGGIATVATSSTNVQDNILPQIVNSSQSTITYNGALSGLQNVADGVVQIDQTVRADSSQIEDRLNGATFGSTLDQGQLGFAGDLGQILYLPNAVSVERAIYLIR